MSSAYRKIEVPWESWFRKRVDVYNEEERANDRTLGDTRLNWKRRGRVTVKDNSQLWNHWRRGPDTPTEDSELSSLQWGLCQKLWTCPETGQQSFDHGPNSDASRGWQRAGRPG